MQLLESGHINEMDTSRFGLKRFFNGCGDCGFSVNYRKTEIKISIEQSIAMMVNNFKTDLESTLQQTVEACVVTIPSSFNSGQRFAVKNAIRSTGIDVIAILNSSTASAITYVHEKLPKKEKKIVIIDMGASFLDVGVFRVNQGSVETLASGCEFNLGGNSFVWPLFNHFVQEIQQETGVNVDNDNKLKARLFLACEKLKEKLSATNEDAREELGIIDGKQSFTLKMTKVVFEDISALLLDSVVDTVSKVVTNSNVNFNKKREIILVGNGGRIPIVQERLRKIFKINPIKLILNSDEAIATGAAYFINGQNNITEIVTTKLEVEIGTFRSEEIMQGTKLPNNKEVSIIHDKTVDLRVRQRNFVFTLHISKSIIHLHIDQNGLVRVFSEGQISESEFETSILLDHWDVNKQKVKEIRDQESKFATNDHKEEVKQKNDLQQTCYSIQHLMNNAEDLKELSNCCEHILSIVKSQATVDLNEMKEDCQLMKSILANMKEWKKLVTKVKTKNAAC